LQALLEDFEFKWYKSVASIYVVYKKQQTNLY